MQTKFSKSLLLGTTAFSLLFATTTHAYLSPLSFPEMYAYASDGNMTVLNNAILRGLDINSVNEDGDTGICVAIKRNDHIAYTSFKKTGANPHPACLQRINKRQYQRFMKQQEPYEEIIEGENNTMWWWIGGAAVAGGVALAAGGGGGGVSSHNDTPQKKPEDPTVHSDKGLGYVVGTTQPSEPETLPYSSVLISAEKNITQVNREALQVANDSKMWVYNPETAKYDTVDLSSLIDFDSDINYYTRYLMVGMRAHEKSVIINDSEQTISLNNNTVGMDALLNSSASNLGTIEMSAKNGSIAMLASDYSEAVNNGTISMEYSGKTTSDSVIGMYADTNSTIINNGTITGRGETAFGKITGMQTRLTDHYKDFVNKAENKGKIELSGSSNDVGGMALWGMSSWLDQAFIDGTKSIENLDRAELVNSGEINLTFTLQPAEEGAVPVANPKTLTNGKGGIVGIHADANTSAVNKGKITATITGDAGQSIVAGMQAVRGGNITNEAGGEISVTAEGTAYGMISVTGDNKGDAFANVSSTITNNGTISLTSKETSYGIYSSTLGDINNNGNIAINGYGYGIFSQKGNVNSTGGNIVITGTGEKGSYGIYAQGEKGDGYKINNAANITMTFTPDEESGSDDGEEKPNLPSNFGIYGWRTDITNSGNILMVQNNEKYDDIYGIASEDSNIDNRGNVTIYGGGSAVYANGGNLVNSGTITVNGAGYALIADAGNITNSGRVVINGFGYGLFVSGGKIENNGQVEINGSGWGLYAENSDIVNNSNGKINFMADDSAAIYGITAVGNGHDINNAASIVFGSKLAHVTQEAKAINGGSNAIVNSGEITIGSASSLFDNAYGIFTEGGSINNSGNISLYGTGYGIYGVGTITNSGVITLHSENDKAPIYGIFAKNGTLTNQSQINILSNKAQNTADVFGLYAEGSKIINSGDVKIGDTSNLFNNAYGIKALNQSIENSGTVRLYGAGKAISAENGNIVNNVGGDITFITNGAADSFGIYLKGSDANSITNHANIKLNKDASYKDGKKVVAIYSEDSNINNSGSLELGAKDAVITNAIGIEALNADINNEGTISVYGNGGNAINISNGNLINNGAASVYGNGSIIKSASGNVTNNQNGILNIYTDGKASAYGIYATGSASNTITNKASITVNKGTSYAQGSGTANYAIWTDNAKIVNSGAISLGTSSGDLKNLYGLYASGTGNIENSGTINLFGAGTGIYTQNGSVNNLSSNGIISIKSDGSADSYGITTADGNNNKITNGNKITISAADAKASAKKNVGIKANNIDNNGTIEIGSNAQAIDNAIGLQGKAIINGGEIRLVGSNVNGIYANQENASITNSGKIDIKGCTNGSCHGIWIENGNGSEQVSNTGEIVIAADDGAYGILNADGIVINEGAITINASSSYGISAKEVNNSGTITLQKDASYALATDNGSIINTGNIILYGDNNDGLYATGGSSVTNEGDITIGGNNGLGINSTDSASVSNQGNINTKGSGSYAMKVTGGNVDNIGQITVSGDNSYGIWVKDVISLDNKGNIIVDGNNGYAIHAEGSSKVTNSGQITVNGQNGFGIHAKGTSQVTNSGDIYMNATSATSLTSALYAADTASITNDGNLYIKGSANSNIYAAYTEGSGKIVNNGTIYVNSTADTVTFGNITNNGKIEAASGKLSLNGNVVFGKDANFSAEAIEGTASVSAESVKDSNKSSFVFENNFNGDTTKLSVKSESFLFKSDFDGEKTTLTMKEFSEVEENASIGEFLKENYAQNNRSDLFDDLKDATSQAELTAAINAKTGRDFVPAMAEQSLAIVKNNNRQISNSWFAADDNEKFVAGLGYHNREYGARDGISGSDTNALSVFGLMNNNDLDTFRYGLGWSFTKADTKFDNDVSKDEIIAQILLPYGVKQNRYAWFGNVYGGYGYGDYERFDDGVRYKGDIKNYYYGINNEIRADFKTVYGISLQPTAEFNIGGIYQRGINDGGIKVNHTNNVSIESGLGLFVEKEFSFDKNGELRIRSGGTWYHEFNDNYQITKAHIFGMNGTYSMDELTTVKDRALLSVNAEYKKEGFSLFGESAYEIGRDENWIFNVGVKYAF